QFPRGMALGDEACPLKSAADGHMPQPQKPARAVDGVMRPGVRDPWLGREGAVDDPRQADVLRRRRRDMGGRKDRAGEPRGAGNGARLQLIELQTGRGTLHEQILLGRCDDKAATAVGSTDKEPGVPLPVNTKGDGSWQRVPATVPLSPG